MWHDSVCNTVQEPTGTSIIVAKKTAAWRESGFPSEFLAGVINTLKAALMGIALATGVGFVVGVARLSSNWLVAKIAGAYI